MADVTNSAGIWGWFSHPLVGFIGTLSGLISIPLAVVFYVRSTPSRELGILEPPVRSVVLSREAPAALDVRIAGEPVTGKDVFAVQLAIWNMGNQSIRPMNVLEPVTFWPAGTTRVVEAKILRRTREVCGVVTQVEDGGRHARVEWNILEPGDGALLQLLLVGDQGASVGLRGTIEGGGTPRYIRQLAPENPGSIDSPRLRPSLPDILGGALLLVALAFVGARLVLVVPKMILERGVNSSRRVKATVSRVIGGVLILLAVTGGALMMIALLGTPRLPSDLFSALPPPSPPEAGR